MVGDTSDYVKLVSIVKKKVQVPDFSRDFCASLLTDFLSQKLLEVPPAEFILGAKKSGDDAGDDLEDDTQICSCHVRVMSSFHRICLDHCWGIRTSSKAPLQRVLKMESTTSMTSR